MRLSLHLRPPTQLVNNRQLRFPHANIAVSLLRIWERAIRYAHHMLIPN